MIEKAGFALRPVSAGLGLDPCWKHLNPKVLIVDSAFSNRTQMMVAKHGHLCPILIREEILAFRKQRG